MKTIFRFAVLIALTLTASACAPTIPQNWHDMYGETLQTASVMKGAKPTEDKLRLQHKGITAQKNLCQEYRAASEARGFQEDASDPRTQLATRTTDEHVSMMLIREEKHLNIRCTCTGSDTLVELTID